MKRLVALVILATSSVTFAQEARPPEDLSTVILYVNEQPVTRGTLETVRRSNPIFNLKLDGAVGLDLENLLVDQTVFLEAAAQDAASLDVPTAELEQAVREFRKVQGLEREETLTRWFAQTGWTQDTLQASFRQRLLIAKRIAAVQAGAQLQAGDLETHYLANRAQLVQTGLLEDRVLARQIVVNDLDVVKRIQEALRRGQDFAALAQKFSLSGAAKGGAVNTNGSNAPAPVTRAAFPAAVAGAVFKLADGKVTAAVRNGANVYFVKVIRVLPASQQPLTMQTATLRARLQRDVLELRREQAIEGWLDRVRAAKLRLAAGVNFAFFNPLVASVGSIEFRLADINRLVYFDPQVSRLLLAGSKGSSGLVPQYFKTQALQTLLDEATAAQLAVTRQPAPIGPRARVLATLVQDVGKGVRVSSGEAQDHYWMHIREFIMPASAKLIEAAFKTSEAADIFRSNLIRTKGERFGMLAARYGGSSKELGRLTSDATNSAYADAFNFDTTTRLTRNLRVSRVLKVPGGYRVLLVQGLTASRTPRFREVRDLVTARALEDKRALVVRSWLDAQRQKLGGINRLTEVNAELEAQAKAMQFMPEPPVPLSPVSPEPAPPEPAQTTPAQTIPAPEPPAPPTQP